MLKKGIKFLLAGILNTGITFLIYILLIKTGTHYNTALAVTYAIGIAFGFLINMLWTFSSAPNLKSTERLNTKLNTEPNSTSSTSKLVRYITVYALVFLTNIGLLNAMISVFSFGPILAQVIALPLATALSYALQNHWVFSTRH